MKNEDDFISGIEDTLHAYEDAYVPGAWEAFHKKRKRRSVAMLFFRAGVAAAVLLLICYGAVPFLAKLNVPVQLTQTKNISPKPSPSNHENVIADSAISHVNITDHLDAAGPGQTLAKHDTAGTLQNMSRYVPVNKPAVTDIVGTVVIADNKAVKPNDVYKPVEKLAVAVDTTRPAKPAVNVSPTGIIANNQTDKYKTDNKPVYDMLVNSKTNHQTVEAIKPKVKSLSYAVMVSPALGNQKVNFGTGVQVSYHFNNNLSVSSGIAYSSLNATAAGNAGNDPARKVQGVDLAVSGFEVPLGLQYKTNNGFYVSAGVVGMSVLNDHLDYNYLTQTTVTAFAANAAGLTQPVLRVATEQKTEESKEKINNYMGFYILSIGKKKAVGRNQINFGPFLRVPFGVVSSEKVNLMQGGVHLGFEF